MNLIFKNRLIKGFTLFITALLFVSFHISCINETITEPEMPGGDNEVEATLYINLNISLPTTVSTRSETEDDGSSDYEKVKPDESDTYVGVENENIINGLNIYFCSVNTETNVETCVLELPYSSVIDFNKEDKTTQKVTVSIPVTADQLANVAGQSNLKVYFVGNLTDGISYAKDVQTTFDASLAYLPNINVNSLPVFADKEGYKIPVTSIKPITVSFTGVTETDLSKFKFSDVKSTDFSTAYNNLTAGLSQVFSGETVELKRVFSRIDYRDRSSNGYYPILSTEGNACKLKLKMHSLTPLNVSRQSFLFPHTAKGDKSGVLYNETTGYSVTIFGNENNNEYFGEEAGKNDVPADADVSSYWWVADADWDFKRRAAASWSTVTTDNNLKEHFYNVPSKSTNTVDTENGFQPSLFNQILNEEVKYNASGNDYYPWCYLSENTLPTTEAMIRGLSTGIAFKVLLCDKDGSAIEEITSSEDLKDPEGEDLYGGMIEFDDENQIAILKVNGESMNLIYEDHSEDIVDDGETPEENGYYLTYYYFFRHNVLSDHVDGTHDPMQFSIVRNNIYRIAVTGFNGIPKPFDPEEPDEPSTENYISVEIRILAWAKRDITVSW